MEGKAVLFKPADVDAIDLEIGPKIGRVHQCGEISWALVRGDQSRDIRRRSASVSRRLREMMDIPSFMTISTAPRSSRLRA